MPTTKTWNVNVWLGARSEVRIRKENHAPKSATRMSVSFTGTAGMALSFGFILLAWSLAVALLVWVGTTFLFGTWFKRARPPVVRRSCGSLMVFGLVIAVVGSYTVTYGRFASLHVSSSGVDLMYLGLNPRTEHVARQDIDTVTYGHRKGSCFIRIRSKHGDNHRSIHTKRYPNQQCMALHQSIATALRD
jgi:hypothetical protein